MIGPPLPPADPWDAGPGGGGAAAWRERERRQRSVRLLMMFLLMLLLMDGEEHQARQRRGDYKLRTPPKPLEESVYRARLDQDERVHKVLRNHKRYKDIIERNGGINVDLQVRKWADQQQELEQDTFDARARVKEDPENENQVYHYPWNSTGFYRGEWVRDGPAPEDEEQQGEKGTEKKVERKEETVDKKKVASKEKKMTLSPVDLEGPMEDMLKERGESVGVFLLPKDVTMNMGNFSQMKTEAASAWAAAQALREHARRAPQSPFLRVNHPEIHSLVNMAFDENSNSSHTVTLSKQSGRAAFQFYSRAIPAMKEISLVDGLVKLYDSNTVGYSTRRDILLRARGVMIHSIGRLSLVSNADPGRTAFVVFDEKKKKDDEWSNRRLQESIATFESGDFDDEHVEKIRDDILALYPFDPEEGNDFDMEEGGWQFTSLNFDESLLDEGRDIHSFRDILQGLPISERRRLSEDELAIEMIEDSNAADSDFESDDEMIGTRVQDYDADDSQPSKDLPRTLADPLTAEEPSVVDTPPQSVDKPGKSTTKSESVVRYPFVPDDEDESIRKAKTPLARKMQPRDQLLEVNAGLCEFEINLDVAEVEWTLGQWRTMMNRLVRESNQLDPSLLKKELDEGEQEEEHESVKAAHTRTKHSRPSTPIKPLRGRIKIPQDQALVMTMLGAIHSPNCDFTASLNATAIRTDWEHTTGKAINYSFYMMLACLIQIVVLLRQLLHTQSQSAATRVSLLSVGWQTVVDALVCLVHIYLSLAMQPLFTAFASVAFFKLLIFCVIEMKYMAIIIQARNSTNGQNTTEILRRQVAMLHLRFYVALVGAFLAFFYAGSEYRTVYILALYSFWVPQIVQNVITEAKRPLHNYYIYGMSFTRLLAPLYIFGVPNNFLKEVYPNAPTDVFMCELLVLWIGIQTAVLIAQGKYGARFMIPARFLPPKFDYSRPIPASMLPQGALELAPSDATYENERPAQEMQTLLPTDSASPERHSTSVARNRIKGSRGVSRTDSAMTSEPVQQPDASHSLDCVICYNGIDVHNRKGYMLAPCNHIFHRECLVQWMDVKMECPICRTELPSL